MKITETAVTQTKLQRLLDESDLRDLLHRYAFGLDNQDWDMWSSVFTGEVTIDMTDWSPGPAAKPLPVDKHVRGAQRMFANFEVTQHFMGSHRYAIDGDRAVVTAHMRAEHWIASGAGGDRYTMYGTYTDDCVRTEDGWKIERVKLSRIREEGNRHVMALATMRPRPAATDRSPQKEKPPAP